MEWLNFILIAVVFLLIFAPLAFSIFLRMLDKNQQQHSILRNFPLLGKARYLIEKVGPEMRQYLFDDDHEGKPFSREDYQHIVLPAKYQNNMIGFGSKREFDSQGYYVKNAMFPKQREEMRVDNSDLIETKKYEIDEDGLFKRKEHRKKDTVKPWLLPEEDAVVIGPGCREPFKVRGLIGMSGMSYGSLGERAITALSKGLGMSHGTWMNTGEGGLSPYHLEGDVDIIMQVGPGLFGVRTKDGELDWDELKHKADLKQVKAIELKLGQGAKTRGGHLDGSKVSPKIAEIRRIEPYKTVDSPNRFNEFQDYQSMFAFINQVRDVTGLPVGIKLVVGGESEVEDLAENMKIHEVGPDFITVDGSEGGTGATYQELADGVGLPIRAAVPIVDDMMRKHGVRDRVKIIASGKMFTADRVAMILSMGADLVNIARAFMITVGCIMALRCHTNTCPVGVATTDDELQQGLVIEEKSYRVLNYLVTLREGLYNVAAASGLDSPTQFSQGHVVFKDERGQTVEV
ncbi:FMN-binding glutamate synthase family protein [Tuberibacillus sp. Marseille-P3662]|uniref:FMN-binding glutamate synthase family protein n=1 Tax=Tuberibacillus sp. Marseille-P3662 TaxID=1965358 RepID=UPI000A1C7EDE|nr:FMN-binding glutamate synthase family protein [Tuberibacillus sp. Marseille-P3662]